MTSGDITAGDHGPGDRREGLEQRLHLVVAERVERRQRKRVGGRFDVVLQFPARLGQRSVVVEQPALGQPFFVVTPRRLVVIAGAGDVFARNSARRGLQDVGLPAGDTRGAQYRDVRVTAMFAQQRRGLPQRGQRIVRPRQCPIGGEQRSPVERGLLRRFSANSAAVVTFSSASMP